MTDFLGSWRLVSVDGFDDYLKELGINVVLRKLAAITVPTLTFSFDNNGGWTMRTETPVRSVNAHFRLGEQFKETTVDLRSLDCTFTLEEEDKELVQWQTDKQGRKSRIGRKVKTDQDGNRIMETTMECNGAVSKAIFKKLQK